MSQVVKKYLDSQKKKNLPSFKVGDIIRIYQEIEEGGKTRVQPFEGLVIAKKHGQEIGATFTLRTKIGGIGTEKILPLHSPTIKKIEVIKSATNTKKAKLYWVRKKTEREIRKRLRLKQQTQQKTDSLVKRNKKKKNK